MIKKIMSWLHRRSLGSMVRQTKMEVVVYCFPEELEAVERAFSWLEATYPRGIRNAQRAQVDVVGTHLESHFDEELGAIFLCLKPGRSVEWVGGELAVYAWQARCRRRGLPKEAIHDSVAREELRLLLRHSRKLQHTEEQRAAYLLSWCDSRMPGHS